MNHPDDTPNPDQWHLDKKVPLSLIFAMLVQAAMVIWAASNPVGLAFGAMAGLGWWASTADQRLFAEACAAERQRVNKPLMPCLFNGTPI